MKNLILITFVLFNISCGLFGSEDSINLDNSSIIDVRHQNISLNVQNGFLIGETTLFLSGQPGTKEITLGAAEMDIHTVEIDRRPAEYSIDSLKQKLHIKAENLLRNNNEITLKVSYQANHKNQSDPANIWGSFGRGVRYFKPTLTDKDRRHQVWAFGEAESAKYWFPCNENPADVRTTEISITAFAKAISNGSVMNTTIDEERFTTIFKEDKPYPAHQTFFVVGNYHNYNQSYHDVIINNYGYPDEQIGTKESVISLPDMMQFFSDYTGVQYPYKQYSQIFVQDFAGWKPGLATSIITENMIDDKTTHEDFLYGWDITQGEALAAQWFGSYLKPKSWRDTWLSKGFSRYFSGLYNQYANGKTEFLTYQHSPDLTAYLNDWNNAIATQMVPDSINNLDAFVNGNAPYAKGARVLHMLRKELGEGNWKELIRAYCKDYGNSVVATEDFIRLVNKVSKTSMDWFFEQWIYGVGHPIFKVEKEFDQSSGKLRLTVLQSQKVDSIIGNQKIPYFKGKVFVEIEDQIEELQLEPKRVNKFEFQLNEKPKLVNFDYEDTWIKESSFAKNKNELLDELSVSTDVLHKVDTMQKLTGIAVNKSSSSKTKEAVKRALQSKASNEEYWRMRLIGLSQLVSLYPVGDKGNLVLDIEMERLLLELVKKEKSWMKAWAINFLGNTRNQKYVPIYLKGLKDYSDRVVFMSAIALGKSNDNRAFQALMSLPDKPSWKNQSLISAMYGLKELKDPRAYNFTLQTLADSERQHWNLGTPIWDHRLAAANTLVALGKVDEGYDLVYENYKDALVHNNVNDIFYNAQIIAVLGDIRGEMPFTEIKDTFKNDDNVMVAADELYKTYKNAIKGK